MPAGFESYNGAGRVQFNADSKVLTLSTSGTVTTRAQNTGMGDKIYPNIASRFTVSYIGTTTSAPIVCISPSAESTLERYTSDGQGFYTWQFMSALAVGAATPYWIFDNQGGASYNYGLELYNSAGQKTYQTNVLPMRIMELPNFTTASPNSTNYVYTAGRIYAVGYGSYVGDVRSNYAGELIGGSEKWDYTYGARATKAIANGVNISRWAYNSGTTYYDFEDDRPGNLIIVDVTNYGQSVVSGGSYSASLTSISGNSSAASTTQDFVRSVSASGGTPTGYTWSVTPTAGWSIVSGQGTTQATARVTGVAAGTTSTATMSCTVSFSGTSSTATATSSLAFNNSSSGATPSVSVSPTTLSTSTASGSSSLGSSTATVSNGTATAYSWSVINQSGTGTFTVTNGTTATASVSVSGVPNSSTTTATLRCTATVNGSSYTADCTLSHQNTTVSGGGSYAASVNDQYVQSNRDNGPATATYYIDTDGNAKQGTTSFNGGNVITTLEAWRDAGVSSDYEVMFSNFSDLPGVGGSTRNTWLSCGTQRSVNLTAPLNNSYYTSFTVSIRVASTQVVLDTATIQLEATAGNI